MSSRDPAPCALYGRNLPRVYLDADAIRLNSGLSDERLLELAQNQDPGLDLAYFAFIVSQVSRLKIDDVTEYGMSESELTGMQQRLSEWAKRLRGEGEE